MPSSAHGLAPGLDAWRHWTAWVGVRLVALGAAGTVAVFVPKFHVVASFTGCLGGVMLRYANYTLSFRVLIL